MAITNQNLIQEEIKRLNSGNACYHSLQNLLSSSLLPQNIQITIYKTIILPVVLYWCEIWSITLKEKHRLRVFENKALRTIFGPKRDEVTGGWRKLHNEEFHNLYSSSSLIRRTCRTNGKKRNAYRIFMGKPAGKKRPQGRPRHRWVNNTVTCSA
jgi:hypothetical protein